MEVRPAFWRWLLLLATAGTLPASAGTVALWLFDEPEGLYPSSILNDASGHGLFLALGRGGRMAEGRFGRALEPIEPPALQIGHAPSNPQFGLGAVPKLAGRTVEPMTWMNATFCALATTGEKHLRSPGFANVTDTKLNLGDFDWTVEFWFLPTREPGGVVFEIGEGPRGENGHVSRLTLDAGEASFTLVNQPGGVELKIASSAGGAKQWTHLAFVYDLAARQLRHFVDGVLQPLPTKAALKALPHGEEAYFSIGRDGLWRQPLSGRMDELRFSDHQVYTNSFRPPGSFSLTYGKGLTKVTLQAGPPLLFSKTGELGISQRTTALPLPKGEGRGEGEARIEQPRAQDLSNAPSNKSDHRASSIELGSRKHLFLDDALVAEMKDITFTPNPPRRAEQVLEDVHGHLSLVDDEQGLLRLYYRGPADCLAVMTSRDGVHWEKPDLGHGDFHGEKNVVVRQAVGLGNVFIDPNAPPESRWKYVSGIRKQAIFVFTSPDGWSFTPHEVAALPFSAGSQSIVYYDDQRQLYVGHHRSDYGKTPGGHTQRRFVLSETKELLGPWPWERITPERTAQVARQEPIQSDKLDPWFLDNGPLTPSGPGIELPTVFGPERRLDPAGTDIYTTKVVKYPWAPDSYLAFPAVYFHYDGEGPPERETLGSRKRQRGSGVVEVQLAVSRDGLGWKRYPRPAYVPIGGNGSNDVHMFFMTHGIVRRGNELWQYVGGHDGNGIGYHSAFGKKGPWPLIRLVQRLDGFAAAEAAYTGGTLKTRPLKFQGNRLKLNIDTGAVGFAQVGFLDENGQPIPGYSMDECVYINGDFLDTPVEWMERGSDVSSLAGRTVQLVFRMSGTKLYAMQFVKD
jgi:hypothetical protein